MQGYHSLRAYIATQSPLPTTTEDFWNMVWEQEVSTIIMLSQAEEKEEKYWPDTGVLNVSNLQVINHTENDYPNYTLRGFKVVDTQVFTNRKLLDTCRTQLDTFPVSSPNTAPISMKSN
jgi:protein tyrosine phosphatase